MSRQARVATVSMGGRPRNTIEGNREHGLALLDEALRCAPDLVCLPEAFPLYSIVSIPLEKRVERVDGPTVSACAARARAHRCNIVCPIKREHEGRFYNSAVLIDRAGEIAGIYDKVWPVTSTSDYTVFEGGITPGREVPVFDLDIGPTGVQICFDIGFPESWAALESGGARLVLWSSAYPGGFPLRCFAYLHRYWVVSAVRAGRAAIIDPVGEVLAETGPDGGVVWRDISLDYLVVNMDFHRGIAQRVAAAYGDGVAVRRWDPDCSNFIIEVKDEALTAAKIQRELGIETARGYFQRHRDALAVLRDGGVPAPQTALHGGRDQYEEPAP